MLSRPRSRALNPPSHDCTRTYQARNETSARQAFAARRAWIAGPQTGIAHSNPYPRAKIPSTTSSRTTRKRRRRSPTSCSLCLPLAPTTRCSTLRMHECWLGKTRRTHSSTRSRTPYRALEVSGAGSSSRSQANAPPRTTSHR